MHFDSRYEDSIHEQLNQQEHIPGLKPDQKNANLYWLLLHGMHSRGDWVGMEVGKLEDCSCCMKHDLCMAFEVTLYWTYEMYDRQMPELNRLISAVIPPDSIPCLSGEWGKVWLPEQQSRYTWAVRYCRAAGVLSNHEAIIAALADYVSVRVSLVSAVTSIGRIHHFPEDIRLRNAVLYSSPEEALDIAMAHYSFSRQEDSSFQGKRTGIRHEDIRITADKTPLPAVNANIFGPVRGDRGIEYEVELTLPEYPNLSPGGVFHLEPWLEIFRENSGRAGIDFQASVSGSQVLLAFSGEKKPQFPPIAIAHICRYAADSAGNLVRTLESIKKSAGGL